MMRNFPLENGIYCKGKLSKFKLYYNNKAVTPFCNAIAYIPKKLIVVKSNKTVHVYRPEIVTFNNTPTLNKLAAFKVYDTCAYLKVKIDDKVYIIDSNVQIKLCECAKMY